MENFMWTPCFNKGLKTIMKIIYHSETLFKKINLKKLYGLSSVKKNEV